MHRQQNMKLASQIIKLSLETFGTWHRVDWPPTGVIMPDAAGDIEAHNKIIIKQGFVL